MQSERTLVIVKPDAIARRQVGTVFSRIEPLKLHVIGAKVIRPTRELAETHYAHIKGRPFFDELIDHITGKLHGTTYVLAFIFYGPDAVGRVRAITGATDPEKADPFSIRGSLGRTKVSGLMENVIHASASAEEAEHEIGLWFKPEEILEPPAL